MRLLQIFDLQEGDNDKNFNEYVGMLDKEMRFIFGVLRASPDRTFDLTAALFQSLDVAQKTIFRVMKYRLSTGATRYSFTCILSLTLLANL